MAQVAKHNKNLTNQGEVSDGILLIDKNMDETSAAVVRKIKKATKSKKVGHAGTLDPFATGLLIILLGQGTKLSPYLMAGRKRYLATMNLGVETDTLDLTGRILQTGPVPDLKPEEIKDCILEFIGTIDQVPPMFSAVNLNGKRAYELARKGVKVELKTRQVKIYSLKIISIELPDITIEVECSGGTYIRSLAADIGKKLGTFAHLKALRRLGSGSFDVKEAIDSKQTETVDLREYIQNRLISLRDALPDMEEAAIDISAAKKIRNGYRPDWKEFLSGVSSPNSCKDCLKLINGKSLVAIMEMNHPNQKEAGWLKKIRVFN